MEGDYSWSDQFNSNEVRMDVARDAIKQLVDTYGQFGDVKIQLVSFAYDTTISNGWLTIDQAKAWLDNTDNTTPGGLTAYDTALDAAMSQYNSYAASDADQTFVYFVSDGEPYSNTDKTNALAKEAEWEAFIDDNGIDAAYAIGFGTAAAVPVQYLNAVAYTSSVDDGTASDSPTVADANTYVVTSADALSSTLISTTLQSGEGNVFAGSDSLVGSVIGADGGSLASITIDGVDYANNGQAVTHDLSANRGSLTIHFGTGDYSYSADRGSNGGEDFSFSFTANFVDGDGDAVASAFQINVAFPDLYTGTADDDILIYDASNAYDGLAGTDSLILQADDGVLDFSGIGNITNIERIDLGEGTHSVSNLTFQDVFEITGNGGTLTILGGSDDAVSLSNSGGTWSDGGTTVVDGHQFTQYDNGGATLLIEDGIDVTYI
jgi:hypothetical protein